jgi:hypothetical protein
MHDYFDGAAPAAPTTQLLGYQVPIDPMDELQCESCQ